MNLVESIRNDNKSYKEPQRSHKTSLFFIYLVVESLESVKYVYDFNQWKGEHRVIEYSNGGATPH